MLVTNVEVCRRLIKRDYDSTQDLLARCISLHQSLPLATASAAASEPQRQYSLTLTDPEHGILRLKAPECYPQEVIPLAKRSNILKAKTGSDSYF